MKMDEFGYKGYVLTIAILLGPWHGAKFGKNNSSFMPREYEQ